MYKTSVITLFLLSIAAVSAEDAKQADGIHVADKSFPWQVFIDRGKLLGCIYDSRFYSLGSILILESLPRKCELASDRNGTWNQLSEIELLQFKESIETQRKLEQESTYIGSDPVTEDEARVIRYLRKSIATAGHKKRL